MSTPFTHAAQLARLDALGLRTAHLPRLRDVDHFEDAIAVAAGLQGTSFEAVLGEVIASIDARHATAGAVS